MRVLVCGDRKWTDRHAIERELKRLPPDTTIIHGGARGADSLAGEIAGELGLGVECYPADWTRYGRAAGSIRNRQMLAAGPELVLAFHEDLSQSKGTKDMVAISRASRIPTTVFDR